MMKYREFNNPFHVKIVSESEYEEQKAKFIERCYAAGKPAFETFYWFTNPEGGPSWDRETAIVDRLAMEADASGHGEADSATLVKTQRVVRHLLESALIPRVRFSGNSGFAIELHFDEVTLKNKYSTVTKFLHKLNEKTGRELDSAAFKGTRQKFRIEGSRHQKTGLYSMYITLDELFSATSIQQIRDIAKTYRVLEVTQDEKHANAEIPAILQKLDVEEDSKIMILYDIPQPGEERPLRWCVEKLIEDGNTSFDSLTVIAAEMIYKGWADANIHLVLKKMSKIAERKGGRYRYNEKIAGGHIEKLREKGLHPTSCVKLQMMGLCNPAIHQRSASAVQAGRQAR